jgi:pimeloyl-ACP methyl ester carboxylesterase
MKDEDPFSNDDPPLSSPAHERGADGDGRALASPPTPLQDTPASAHLPRMGRRLPSRHHVRLLLGAIVVVVLVALAGGYGLFRAVSPPSRQASTAFQQAHCPFPLGAGLVEGHDVRCGFLVVPEDRSLLKSPTLRLAVAVFKTPNPRPAPDPVLFLGGGPGLPQLVAASRINASNLDQQTAGRDLILFDQRGVGSSQPSLRCFDEETLRACHDRLVQAGINLHAYTTLSNAADVHDLVRALGYKQVNLQGVSYGTRLALTVMRLYPADLHSVVLDSVFPVNATSRAAATSRAFDALFQRCATDHYCNTTYSHLQAVFSQLVTDLNTAPITLQATSQAGSRLTVHFTGNNLVYWLQGALEYTDLIPQVPQAIYHLRQHDSSLLSQSYGYGIDTLPNNGLYYSALCGEDMAFTTQHDLEMSVQGLPPPIRPALLDWAVSRLAVCQFWGMKAVPAVQKQPVTSSIPTLILEGEDDPVTPPPNGLLVAQTLSKSYFFLFPGVGHGVASAKPSYICANEIMNAFWDNPTEKPDASCIPPEPDFV